MDTIGNTNNELLNIQQDNVKDIINDIKDNINDIKNKISAIRYETYDIKKNMNENYNDTSINMCLDLTVQIIMIMAIGYLLCCEIQK